MYAHLFVLNFQIENMRLNLHNLISDNSSLTDSKVVECSQKLDKLLVLYEKTKNCLMAA